MRRPSTDYPYHFSFVSSPPLSLIDLYCGLGGLSLGFELTGAYRTLAGIDIFPPALSTFYASHPFAAPEFQTPHDLGTMDPADFVAAIGGKPDVIAGGPPCQGFSHAGRRLEDFCDDPRNSQVNHFFRFVREIRPRAFLMENVSGILLTGQARRSELVEQLKHQYEDLGYSVSYKVLNTADFRVPQTRRRFIMVGLLDGKTPFRFPEPVCSSQGESLLFGENQYTVFEALGDLPIPIDLEPQPYLDEPRTELQRFLRDGSDALFNHLVTKHSDEMTERLRKQATGTRLYPNWNHSWFRLDPNRPSPAVKENHRAPFVHFREPRATSPRECARLQTIPDRVVLHGTKTAQLIQVGNAVPPLFAAHLATALAVQGFGLKPPVPWSSQDSPLSLLRSRDAA